MPSSSLSMSLCVQVIGELCPVNVPRTVSILNRSIFFLSISYVCILIPVLFIPFFDAFFAFPSPQDQQSISIDFGSENRLFVYNGKRKDTCTSSEFRRVDTRELTEITRKAKNRKEVREHQEPTGEDFHTMFKKADDDHDY